MRFNPAELHMAIIYKNFDAVTHIIESSSKSDYVWRGASPVSCALYEKAYKILDYLVKQGANVNIRTQDYKLEPPLFAACRLGKFEAVKILLKSSNLDIDQKDFFNRTPLWAAARYSSFEMVELLLNHGADVRAAQDFIECPLLQALMVFQKDIGSKIPHLLIRRGCQLHWKSREGSPLYFSVKYEQLDLFTLLIRAGCLIKNETWLTIKNLPDTWKKDVTFCKSIIDLKNNPSPLLHIVICAVRNVLIVNHKNLFPKHVNELHIPSSLQKAILLDE